MSRGDETVAEVALVGLVVAAMSPDVGPLDVVEEMWVDLVLAAACV
jgi:hypothetical protein